MICNVLAAEFTSRGRGVPATLTLNRIIDGHRSKVLAFNVTGKREARQLAKQYGATPWNF
jgi:hypothetical protein